MKKTIFVALNLLLCASLSAQNLYLAKSNGETSFYSETPVENIAATNKKVTAAIDIASGSVAVKMQMMEFEFPNKLMQEHFNENYMESGKYPSATFSGKIVEKIDFTKNGTYDISAKGALTLHGIKQDRTLIGKLTVQDKTLTLVCNFDVKLADHKIDIPQVVFVKIAQTIATKNKFVMVLQEKK
jgi:polyisoprenoid-binding protein YceI